MKLHCDVEVVSRRLPTLGMRNRGKGVRAVLSVCEQTPRGQLPGPPRACLLVSTLKDKRGTRYEVGGRGRRWPGGKGPELGGRQPFDRCLPLRVRAVVVGRDSACLKPLQILPVRFVTEASRRQ